MNSYGLIDLHCDTLAEYWKYAHTGNPDTLDDPGRVSRMSIQALAVATEIGSVPARAAAAISAGDRGPGDCPASRQCHS